jgi:iron-sulfur cluster repair protein YtfE (RIC family)
MLEACHERVQRTLRLLERLRPHVLLHGRDEQAVQAAQDVMRYFDLAAPLHHQDEEFHVFPAVLAVGDAASRAAVKRLMEQHRQMELQWIELRSVLSGLQSQENAVCEPFTTLQADTVHAFIALYVDHIRLEEEVVYPLAIVLLDANQKIAMGADMKKRRGVKSTF